MKFYYVVETEKGFRKTMELENEKEVTICIEAKNYVIANRMIRALLNGSNNIVTSWSED